MNLYPLSPEQLYEYNLLCEFTCENTGITAKQFDARVEYDLETWGFEKWKPNNIMMAAKELYSLSFE